MDFLQSLTSFSKSAVFTDYSLKNNCGYGVGGKAKYYIQPTSVLDIRTTLELCKDFKVDHIVIGNGTNLLISDKGYNGVVICTKSLKGITLNKDKVICSSGETLTSLAKFCIENGLSGLESLYGIPATVGGAVVMNAGAYGKNLSQYVEKVDLIKDGKLLKLDNHDLEFGYRTSLLKRLRLPILSVEFKFDKTNDRIVSKELVKYYTVLRQNAQPKGKSCGSVFINSENYKAGYLIDQAGLKGYSVNKAKVSTKHANFIVTEEGATATDVYNLINHIKLKIKQKFNVQLVEEIEYVGEF